MSDAEHSTVTYTSISSDDRSSDVGSPEPPTPDFIPKPVYPEFMPPEDDFDPEEDSKEEDDEDPEEDPADYPTDRDDEEEEEDSFRDDADDEKEDEDEDEEEHQAPADSVPPLAYHTTARMSIRAQTPIPFPSEEEIPSPPLPTSPTAVGSPLGYKAAMIRLKAESPSTSHPPPLPPPIILLHTRASMVMMRAAAPSSYILAPQLETPSSETPPLGTPPLLPIPLPTSSPPLLLTFTDCGADVLEVTLPPQKRLYIALSPRFEVEECSSAPTARPTRGFREDYGFIGTMDAEIRQALTLLRTLQTQMVALQSQQRPAKNPAHPDVIEEADSSS
nr:hypothetical protein [Tanacetum cinerariifolium]